MWSWSNAEPRASALEVTWRDFCEGKRKILLRISYPVQKNILLDPPAFIQLMFQHQQQHRLYCTVQPGACYRLVSFALLSSQSAAAPLQLRFFKFCHRVLSKLDHFMEWLIASSLCRSSMHCSSFHSVSDKVVVNLVDKLGRFRQVFGSWCRDFRDMAVVVSRSFFKVAGSSLAAGGGGAAAEFWLWREYFRHLETQDWWRWLLGNSFCISW